MTGSTPPRKGFFRKRDATGDAVTGGSPPDGVRDDERGPQTSLEAADADGPGGRRDSDGKAVERAPRPDGSPVGTGRLTTVRNGVRKGGQGAKAGIGYLADRIIENAPRIPVRDLATLRKQFPGLGPEQIADRLVAGARNATSTVGAGVGAAAMLPVPPAMPTELAAEITGVAAIELKMVAELHEVYGVRPPGNLKVRTAAYLHSWSDERGIDVARPMSINAALGGQMKRELRQQITKRMVKNLPNLLPFMVGAAVGAVMNRRETSKLAEKIRKDLRAQQVPWDALEALPPLPRPKELEG